MSEASHFSDFKESLTIKLVAEKLGLMAQSLQAERPRQFAEETREEIHQALTALKIERAQEIIDQLERALASGYHDLVHEFLSNVAKMRQSEFAQELLHDITLRHVGAGLVLNRDIDPSKVGRQVLGLSEDIA